MYSPIQIFACVLTFGVVNVAFAQQSEYQQVRIIFSAGIYY
jgi:hypothetical protein